MKNLFRSGIAIIALLAFGLSGAVVTAQDATPDSGTAASYPVAIHQGTCDDVTTQPAYEIADSESIGAGDDDANMLGSNVTAPVLKASADIDASLDDVANEQHVIAVHASAEDYDTIVACGQVAGTKVDGQLVVALLPVDDSGVTGVAILDEDTSGILGLGDDEIRTTVYIVDQASGGSA